MKTYEQAFSAAAEAEWAALEQAQPPDRVAARGPRDAAVVLVVTPARMPSQAVLLESAAEEALAKGLEALGADWGSVRTIPAPSSASEHALGSPKLLAWEVEIVDPAVVLVAGEDAAALARAAWSAASAAPGAAPGEGGPPCGMGRPTFLLPDVSRALGTKSGKERLWAALKEAGPHLAAAARS